MNDLRVICPSCYTEHSDDRNRILSKFGKYWIEVSSDCGYDLLCGWCWSTIDEVDSNIFYNIDGR